LGTCRTNGITQSQLGKEFGIEGKNLFYVVRNLECQGLIVRQSAVVRTKEACNEGEPKNSPCVITNIMYLYRYAKTLGSQQKIEITKEEQTIESIGNVDENATTGGASSGKCVKEDVHVKDYLPAMKAVCDKLEEATDKVNIIYLIDLSNYFIVSTTYADIVSCYSFIEGSCCLRYKKGSWLLWSSFGA
jgi:general transcription factor 3C polypeptide 1